MLINTAWVICSLRAPVFGVCEFFFFFYSKRIDSDFLIKRHITMQHGAIFTASAAAPWISLTRNAVTQEFRELRCWKAPECHWRLNPWTVREIQMSFYQLTNKRVSKNEMLFLFMCVVSGIAHYLIFTPFKKKKTAGSTGFLTLWKKLNKTKQKNIPNDLFGFTSWWVPALKRVTWFWDQTKVMTGIIVLYLQGMLLTQELKFDSTRERTLCFLLGFLSHTIENTK